MEHFLNTNFPEGVDDCAFLMGKISEEVVKYAHKSDIDCIVVARMAGSGSGSCSPGPWLRKS